MYVHVSIYTYISQKHLCYIDMQERVDIYSCPRGVSVSLVMCTYIHRQALVPILRRYIRMCTHVYIYIYIHSSVCMYIHMYEHIRMYIHTYILTSSHMFRYPYIYAYIYMFIYMCMCISICISVGHTVER